MKKFFSKEFLISLQVSKILILTYGFFKSVKFNLPVNNHKEAIPWYTYSSIEYLNNLDLNNVNIFEYGSGNSSIYFLNKGALVTSVEDDLDWFKKIKNKMEGHNLIFEENQKEYISKVSTKKFDIVVIDGSYRFECAEYTISEIKSNKISPQLIIFDNSDWYENSINLIDKELGWERVDFYGLGPVNNYTWVTSMYFNPTNNLKKLSNNLVSMKGIRQNLD